MACKRCREVLSGADEDELVARVQTHVQGHGLLGGRSHTVSRQQILTRLRRQGQPEAGETQAACPDGPIG